MKWFWVAVIALTFAGVASADRGAARKHYELGLRAYNLQKFDLALGEFQAAYTEEPDVAFLFNIAQSQRQLGQYEAAARSYRAYLAQKPDAPNRRDVQARIADMERAAHERRAAEPPAGTSPPTMTGPAPSATGQPPSATGQAPSATGQPPSATTQPAAATTATATTAPATSVTAHATPADRGRTLRLAGIGVGAVGVAGVILGIVFAVLSKQAGDSAYRGTYDPTADDRQGAYRNADIACFVVGGVAVAAGTTLFLLGRRAAAPSARASLAPTVTGPSLQVSF